jgi:hypothetical protein
MSIDQKLLVAKLPRLLPVAKLRNVLRAALTLSLSLCVPALLAIGLVMPRALAQHEHCQVLHSLFSSQAMSLQVV